MTREPLPLIRRRTINVAATAYRAAHRVIITEARIACTGVWVGIATETV